MAASNQIFFVVDAGTPVAAFTAWQELKAYLRRRLDVFINPRVYTSQRRPYGIWFHVTRCFTYQIVVRPTPYSRAMTASDLESRRISSTSRLVNLIRPPRSRLSVSGAVTCRHVLPVLISETPVW